MFKKTALFLNEGFPKLFNILRRLALARIWTWSQRQRESVGCRNVICVSLRWVSSFAKTDLLIRSLVKARQESWIVCQWLTIGLIDYRRWQWWQQWGWPRENEEPNQWMEEKPGSASCQMRNTSRLLLLSAQSFSVIETYLPCFMHFVNDRQCLCGIIA